VWLRVKKQLSSKDAERIKSNSKKTDFLLQLNDGNFLCEDILSKRIAWEKTTDCIKILVYKNVGPIKTEAYELAIKNGSEEYSKVSRNYQRNDKNNFRIILIRNNVGAPNTNILINVDSPDVDKNEFDFVPREKPKENIFSLATYFYNKFEAYQKISEILLTEKIKLYENMGKVYTDDLISLFSVEKESEATKDYTIPLRNIAVKTEDNNDNKIYEQVEEIYEDTIEIENTRVQISQACEFLFTNSSEKSRIYLSLDEANILYLECPLAFINSQKIDKLTDFINKQLNAWLKDFEKRANFGLSIYEKLKTKILVDNI
jgi:hypothetical protein